MVFQHLDQINAKELAPGCWAKLIYTDNMTVAHWHLEKGAAIPEHVHPHEQVANMIEGEFEFTVDGTTQLMKPGNIAVVPPGAVHYGKARKASYMIDVFYPTREDYR